MFKDQGIVIIWYIPDISSRQPGVPRDPGWESLVLCFGWDMNQRPFDFELDNQKEILFRNVLFLIFNVFLVVSKREIWKPMVIIMIVQSKGYYLRYMNWKVNLMFRYTDLRLT